MMREFLEWLRRTLKRSKLLRKIAHILWHMAYMVRMLVIRPVRWVYRKFKQVRLVLEHPDALCKYKLYRGELDWMSDEAFARYYGKHIHGVKMDLNDPKTFCEKMNWLKLHDHNPDYRLWVDKYVAKQRAIELFGEEHVLPLYGVWDSFDEIDFDKLPNSFVLKCTHDSGSVYICEDKANLDIEDARAFFEAKMVPNSHYRKCREWVYKGLRPRIIAEKFVESLTHYDNLEYLCFCFNGRAEYISLYTAKNNTDREEGMRGVFFDRSGNRLPILFSEFKWLEGDIELPEQYQMMMEWSDRLAEGKPFARVDWYLIDGQIYFSELTFYHASGYGFFEPAEWDQKLSDMIDLEPVRQREREKREGKKNVLFIVPKLYGGGAERVVSRLASALCDRYNVSVYSTHPTPDRIYSVDPRVELFEYSPRPGLISTLKRKFLLDRAAHLRQLKKDLDIDVSISFLRSCNFINVLSRGKDSKIVSIRCVCEKEPFSTPDEKRPADIMTRFAARKADLVVGVSKWVSKEHVDSYGADPNKVITIYNPIDIQEMQRLKAEPLHDPTFERFAADKDFLFISSGRVTAQKGQWHLIRALRTVLKEHPNVGLVILGRGPMEEYLRDVARKNGIENSVYFPGFSYTPFAYYGRANAFVFPSLVEGFPNALLEAMACGLPAISCDCNSGPRELFAPDTDFTLEAKDIEYAPYGVLIPVVSENETLSVEPNEPEEDILARAMNAFVERPELLERYAAAGLKRAEDFATEKIVDEWINQVIERKL